MPYIGLCYNRFCVYDVTAVLACQVRNRYVCEECECRPIVQIELHHIVTEFQHKLTGWLLRVINTQI